MSDVAMIKSECEPVLNDIFIFLNANPTVIGELGGHTNNYPTDVQANQLSLNRAKAVANWLIKKGIPENRLQYKGYGKTKPLVSDEEIAKMVPKSPEFEAAHQKNRRTTFKVTGETALKIIVK